MFSQCNSFDQFFQQLELATWVHHCIEANRIDARQYTLDALRVMRQLEAKAPSSEASPEKTLGCADSLQTVLDAAYPGGSFALETLAFSDHYKSYRCLAKLRYYFERTLRNKCSESEYPATSDEAVRPQPPHDGLLH